MLMIEQGVSALVYYRKAMAIYPVFRSSVNALSDEYFSLGPIVLCFGI